MSRTKIENGVRVRMTSAEEAEADARDAEFETAKTDPTKYPLERWQFHAMLELLGKTDAVTTAMNAISDPTQKAVAKAKLAHTDTFDRDDPLFTSLAPVVGLTQAEIDAAWLVAKDLT